jgi:hypothetical protein
MSDKTFEPEDIIKRSITYGKALYPDDLKQQIAYATGYIAAINHATQSNIYRTVARLDYVDNGKAYIVISAMDPRKHFVVNYNDLSYAMGERVLSAGHRFMINIDIGQENEAVTGFNIADRNIYVGARAE